MLFSSQHIARSWQHTKNFAQRAWHHTTKLAGQLDHGMQLGKKILSAVSPLFDQLGVNYRPAIQGFGAYDQGKAEVMNRFNNVQDHYMRIKRQVPELQL